MKKYPFQDTREKTKRIKTPGDQDSLDLKILDLDKETKRQRDLPLRRLQDNMELVTTNTKPD